MGDIVGIHFDLNGNFVCQKFYDRLLTVRVEDLLKIPVRIRVVGGIGKVEPILGVLRRQMVNILAADSVTAQKVLDLTQNE